MADRTLPVIRKITNWHASRSDDFRSPIVRGMPRTKLANGQGNRILSDDELRNVWKQADTNGAFGSLVKFILLTSTRRAEAAEMAWPEIVGRDWTLAASRNKAKADLIVRPLSNAALSVLPPRGSCDFVLSPNGCLRSVHSTVRC
jgi:hypothetical protein